MRERKREEKKRKRRERKSERSGPLCCYRFPSLLLPPSFLLMDPPSFLSSELSFLYFNDLYEIDNVAGNGGLGMKNFKIWNFKNFKRILYSPLFLCFRLLFLSQVSSYLFLLSYFFSLLLLLFLLLSSFSHRFLLYSS